MTKTRARYWMCEFGIYACDGSGWRCPRHRNWRRRTFKKWGRR